MFKITSIAKDRNMVPFGEKLAGSESFKGLFKEGMTLVEEAAAYLDGPGRKEAKLLARSDALAYASESMRLTTRLMQLASWLLLQRAVNEGELTQKEAAAEKHRVKLCRQDLASNAEAFARLPSAAPATSPSSRCACRRASSTSTGSSIRRMEPQIADQRPPGIKIQLDRLREAFEVDELTARSRVCALGARIHGHARARASITAVMAGPARIRRANPSPPRAPAGLRAPEQRRPHATS